MNPRRTVLVTAHTGRTAAVATARLVVELLISAGITVRVVDTEAAEDYLRETHHIPNITTAELRAMGAEAAALKCLEKLRDVDLIYVSFDVDSLDSAISMGTGTPVPGGLSVEEARILNTTLARDPRVCCWEMCEINPLLDTLNTMAENSLGIFESVVDAIGGRVGAAKEG